MCTVDAASGAITRLTAGKFEDRHVRWGPEGKWIYFSSNRGKARRGVYRVASSGGRVEYVRKGLALDFSADGRTTFVAPTNRQLYMVDRGKLRPLARIAEPQAFAPVGQGFFFLRALSPISVSLEYNRIDGARKTMFFHIENSRRDLTVDRAAKLICWSRVEQPESDLMLMQIDE